MITKLKNIAASRTAYDSFISFSGSFAVTIAGMLFTILAARSLEPSEFGIFSTFMAVAIVLSNVADLGISNVLTNFLPKYPKDRQKIINEGFWFQLMIGGTIFVLCALLYPFGQKLFGSNDVLAFMLFASLGSTYVMDYFLQNLFRAEKKFLEVSIMQAIESFGKLLLLFVVVMSYKSWLGINSLMVVSLLGAFVAIGYAFMFYKTAVRGFKGYFHIQKFADFGLWMAVNKIFGVMVARVDLLILNWLSNSYQTGLFAAASRVAMVFSILVSTIGSVTAPRFASFNTGEKVWNYIKKLSIMIGGFSALMVLCAILADVIVSMVFGAKYIPAIGVFRLLSLAMIPFLWTTLTVTPLIYTYSMARLNATLTVIQVSILVSVELFTSAKYGAYAPVLALLISNLVVFGVSGVILLRKIRE
jgi:enterobacterial common antigen flippase